MSDVIDLDAYRPGWRVQAERCLLCGRSWVAVKHPQAPAVGCECPGCGEMVSVPEEGE